MLFLTKLYRSHLIPWILWAGPLLQYKYKWKYSEFVIWDNDSTKWGRLMRYLHLVEGSATLSSSISQLSLMRNLIYILSLIFRLGELFYQQRHESRGMKIPQGELWKRNDCLRNHYFHFIKSVYFSFLYSEYLLLGKLFFKWKKKSVNVTIKEMSLVK